MTTRMLRLLIIGRLLRQGAAKFNSTRIVSPTLLSVVADRKVIVTESASLAVETTMHDPNATFETQSARVVQKLAT